MNDILHEAFRYSTWATQTVITACRGLSIEQLKRPAYGFGSILDTLNHVVQSDAGYVAILTDVRPAWAADGCETDDLDRIARRVEEMARLWEGLLAEPAVADRTLQLDAGAYHCHASVVIVQAIHHANAHREQIRAGLRSLGVQPPDVQPWEYALAEGRARWVRES